MKTRFIYLFFLYSQNMAPSKTAIPLFPAPRFVPSPLDLARLGTSTGRSWSYAGSGRACLYHILKSLRPNGTIAMPAYLCRSVLEPVLKLGLTPAFFDIDSADLNPSVSSLEILLAKGGVAAVIFPSLYGLPADCAAAEALCKAHGVTMIDDAAQSHGASLHNRPIGTFGDAGFIAFSPGKATAAHAGGLFWTRWPHVAPTKEREFYHRLLLWAFARARAHDAPGGFANKGAKIMFQLLKRRPGWEDGRNRISDSVLGGVLSALDNGDFNFRQRWFVHAVASSAGWHGLRLVQSARGDAHPHKIVLVAETDMIASALVRRLAKAHIRHGGGYSLLSGAQAPIATSLQGRIVELPIIDDNDRMQAMLDCIAAA